MMVMFLITGGYPLDDDGNYDAVDRCYDGGPELSLFLERRSSGLFFFETVMCLGFAV